MLAAVLLFKLATVIELPTSHENKRGRVFVGRPLGRHGAVNGALHQVFLQSSAHASDGLVKQN